MEIYHMENEKFTRLNEKLYLAKLKMERVNHLLDEANNNAYKAIENMNSTGDKLSMSRRRDAGSMKKTMNKVGHEINKRSIEQMEKVRIISNMLLKQESMLTDLKEDNGSYNQVEIDFYIKEVNQDLKNSQTWNKPEYSFKKIDFTNHGGLRGMIFTPIANFNRKSDELAKEIYELNVLINEMNQERLNIELDFFEGMKKSMPSNTQFQPAGALTEQIAGFKPAYESNASSSIDTPILDQKPISHIKGCIGRTAMCGITH
ncbi:hypothetical protein H0913_17475 [Providencia rettgeri]|nr:hypothetical protein [Providencia sp. wls1914]QLR04644.1 hypothetical protein H0913_17475 [Providencia rettgeri]